MGYDMNCNAVMKKLQRAILSTGLVIKISTSQFYSEEQDRMITMWILTTPTLQNGRNGWRMRDYVAPFAGAWIEIPQVIICRYGLP